MLTQMAFPDINVEDCKNNFYLDVPSYLSFLEIEYILRYTMCRVRCGFNVRWKCSHYIFLTHIWEPETTRTDLRAVIFYFMRTNLVKLVMIINEEVYLFIEIRLTDVNSTHFEIY